jgi:F0F1-type ATP synthase assembly protein I
MSESPRHKSAVLAIQRPSSAVFTLAMTALDTTWRTLVPGIAGAVLGIVLDRLLGTKPLFVLTGLVLGIALSALLVYKQFKAVNR